MGATNLFDFIPEALQGQDCVQLPLKNLMISVTVFVEAMINFPTCVYKHRRRQWQPTPGLLPGKSHGRRRLVGCSPWGRYELGTTE